MRAIVDVNIVFSALVTRGNAFDVFEANKAFNKIEFFAPEFLFFELGRRTGKLVSQSKLTKEEFSDTFSLIKSEITLVPPEEFIDKLSEAKGLNLKDAPYLALALKLGCPLISGDKGLKKQSAVRVFSPSEALSLIYGQELPGPELSGKTL